MIDGAVELDEGFFSTGMPKDNSEAPLKRVRGRLCMSRKDWISQFAWWKWHFNVVRQHLNRPRRHLSSNPIPSWPRWRNPTLL